ncbi:hypothetical protein CEXT_391401, partial [Caerostris extrusa]
MPNPPEDDDPRLESGPDPWNFAAQIDWEGDDDGISNNEIDAVISLGVPPSRIVYANCYKGASHLLHAAKLGVDFTVFRQQRGTSERSNCCIHVH